MKKFQTTRARQIPSWSKEFKDWALNEVNKAIEEAKNEQYILRYEKS